MVRMEVVGKRVASDILLAWFCTSYSAPPLTLPSRSALLSALPEASTRPSGILQFHFIAHQWRGLSKRNAATASRRPPHPSPSVRLHKDELTPRIAARSHRNPSRQAVSNTAAANSMLSASTQQDFPSRKHLSRSKCLSWKVGPFVGLTRAKAWRWRLGCSFWRLARVGAASAARNPSSSPGQLACRLYCGPSEGGIHSGTSVCSVVKTLKSPNSSVKIPTACSSCELSWLQMASHFGPPRTACLPLNFCLIVGHVRA